MAARTGRLLQDSNIGIHMDGPTVSAKAKFTGQKKVGAGGRKPLGDLSNSEKLSTQAGGRKALDGLLNSGKQLKSKELVTVKEEVVPVKTKNLESKKTAHKVSEKLPTNRKALSDISNFEKIKNKSSQKLRVLTEEPLHLSAIAEEQCLHNHQECIKSHTEDMGLRNFLEAVGLESGNGNFDDKLAFSSEVPAFPLHKPKSDLKHLELKEIPEKFPEVESSRKEQHASPVRCTTPKISSCYKMWEDFDVNFKLIETPERSKF